MTFTRLRQTDTGVPPAGGILWQMLLNNVATRRSWETLGVHKTLLQWIAVDGYSFVPNPWLPTYNIQLDMDDMATYPWAQEIIVGLPGFFNEYTSRTSLPLMADWAEKFATLDYPSNVKGFYFPVEIDPTWTTAIDDMRDIWPRLPRPLYISAYYGNGIDGEAAAQWLAELIPDDVILMFQDGVGAFGFEIELARERVAQLEHHLGKERVHVICEAFKYNPNWDGTPGGYYVKLTPEEYVAQVSQYSKVNQEGRLWVFDGPNYLTSDLIQRINRVVPVSTPINLAANANDVGDIRMTWERTSSVLAEVTGYTIKIYDTAGNKVLRTYETDSPEPQGFYPIKDSIEDFGFPPAFLVYEVAEKSKRFRSDFSAMYVGDMHTVTDWVTQSVALCGGTYAQNFFTDFSDIANPGTTGAEGGRFSVAAYTLQLAIAAASKVDVTQVGIHNLAQTGSYMSRTAAIAMGSSQYWWDDIANLPGPVLTACAARLGATRITAMVWAGGDDHLAFQNFSAQANNFASAARAAIIGVFRYLRDNHAKNAKLKMWLFPHLRSFYGEHGEQEVNGVGFAMLRSALVNVVRNNTGVFRVGTWVPGSEAYTGYWDENQNWINPTPQVYRTAAQQLGQSIGTDTSRLLSAPGWAVAGVVTEGRAYWDVNDITVTWEPSTSSTGLFRVTNLRVDNMEVISSTLQANSGFSFTEAEQIAEYGYPTSGIMLSVQEWDNINNVGGAVTRIEKYRDPLQAIFDTGLLGAWLDPSDPDTCFVDSSAQVRAQVGQKVLMVLDKSGGGFHFLQPDVNKQPVLRQDVTGKRYLEFNGVNQNMITGKQMDYPYRQAACFAGLKFTGSGPDGVIAESNVNSDTESGSWGLLKLGAGVKLQSRTNTVQARPVSTAAVAAAPLPDGYLIMGGTVSITPSEVDLRVNKETVAFSNAQQTYKEDYTNSVINVGSRGGFNNFMQMDLYQLIVFGSQISEYGVQVAEQQIQNTMPDFTVLEVLGVTFTAVRNEGGDVNVSWVLDVPQPGAQYVFEVMDGNTVAYSVETPLTQATFPYSEAVAIFGDPPPVTVRYRVRVVDGKTSRTQESTLALLGSPVDLRVDRNSWGDVVFRWKTTGDVHAGKNYEVDIRDPANPDVTMRKITVSGTSNYQDGFVYCDYDNTLNIPDAVAARGDQYRWNSLMWQVRCVENDFSSDMVTMDVPEDNNAFVKKVIVCGINSLVGGYFNDLSDPLNPGGTGIEGRRDVVAAQTLRHSFAEAIGLRDVEVMPVQTVVGSSPINPMPYQSGFDLNNYWWDGPNNKPGPNLIYADNIVKTIGRAPDYFIESGPGETTGISFAPVEDRPAILAAWKASNIAMLAWMRANWGNADLNIWFQGATTSWWGDPPPMETNFTGTKLLRDLQIDMGVNTPGFRIGSYVPDSNTYQVFRNEMAEGMGWIHYTVEGYHAAAAEMGQSMGSNTNLAFNPPPWAQQEMPSNLVGIKKPNGDVEITWGTTAPNFRVRMHNPADSSVLRDNVVTGNSWVYTKAMQIADFGNEASYIHVTAAQVISGNTGPYATYVGSTQGSMIAVTGTHAVKKASRDVVINWDARAGVTGYYVRNYNVNNNAVISEGPVSTNSYTFTLAQQNAAYGYDVNFVMVDLYEYDAITGGVGPMINWSGNAQTASTPTNGTATKDGSGDITLAWDALDGATWEVELINVGNGNVIRTRTVSSPTDTFTVAEQVAEYGYTVGFVQWNVTAITSTGAASPKAYFSGSV